MRMENSAITMEEPSRRDPTTNEFNTRIFVPDSKTGSSSSRSVVEDVTKRKRHSFFRGPRKLLGKAGRRISQPEMTTDLKKFLHDQKSQRDASEKQCQDDQDQVGALNEEKELLYAYQAQIEALQQEKAKLKDRQIASDSNSSDLSELVDTHATEMQKTINLCKKQKDTIDTLRKSRHSLKAENEQIKKQVASLKRDRKSLRVKLKKADPKAGDDEALDIESTPSESPPPLLEKASMELLDELLEQDEEATYLYQVVGRNVAVAEAIKVLKLRPALSLEDDTSKVLSAVENQLDKFQDNNTMLEEALRSAEQDKVNLQNLLDEQTKLTEEGVAAKMLVEDEFDLWKLRQSHTETALRRELEEQRALVQKFNSEVVIHLSNAEHFKSMCNQQNSWIATLRTQNDALTDQCMVLEAEAVAEVSEMKLASQGESDDRIRRKLQAAESEIERSKLAGAEYTSTLQNYKASLELRNADLERLAGHNEKLVDEVRTLQEETTRMRELNKRMASTITMQEDAIEGQKLELESLGREKEVLVKELDAAKQSASFIELLKGSTEASAREKELDRKCEHQGTVINSLRQSNDTLSNELQMTKDSMESYSKLLNEKELIFENQSRAVRELEGSLELQATESQYLRQRMGLLAKELEEKRSKLAVSEDSLAAQEKLFGESSRHTESIESSLEDTRVQLRDSLQVVEVQSLQLEQHEEKLRLQCFHIDSFEESKRELELRCTNNDATIESMKGKLDEMKLERRVSQSTCSVLQDQLTATRDAQEEASNKIGSLKEENAALSKALKEAENKASEARLSLTEQTARSAGHAVAIGALQKENEILLKRNLEAKLVTSALQQSLSQLMSARDEDTALRSTFESRIKRLNEDLREAHLALSSRRRSLTENTGMNEAEAMIARLKQQNTKLSNELQEAQLSISSSQKSLAEQKAQHEKEAVNVEHHVTQLATLMEREAIAASKILQMRENLEAQAEDIEMYAARGQKLEEQVHALQNERDNLLALAELHATSDFAPRVSIPVHQEEPNEEESTEEIVTSYDDVAVAPLANAECSFVEFDASFDETSSCGDFANDSDTSDEYDEYFDGSNSEESDGALEVDAKLRPPIIGGSRSLAKGTLIHMDRSEHCKANGQCPTSSHAQDHETQQRPAMLDIMNIANIDTGILEFSKSGTMTKVDDLPPLTNASLVVGSNDSGDEDLESHGSHYADASPEVEFETPFVK
jgi:chromosome segregation ATPase